MAVIARLVVITPAVLVGRAAAAARVSPSVSRLPLVAGCRAVLGDGTNGGIRGGGEAEGAAEDAAARRVARKRSERRTYLAAAVMSSLGFTSMAAAAVYYRFAWQMDGGEVPAREMLGTFALSVGAAVGMEFWARWVYRALWHMHESHHRPRDGPFELNDVFAIANAVPAISLLAYGLLNRGLLPGLCFGAIHTKKRNRLEYKRLNDLVYVSYNRKMSSRFQKRNEKMSKSFDPLVVEDFDWNNEWVNPTANPEGVHGLDLTWDQVDDAIGASRELQGRHFPRTYVRLATTTSHAPRVVEEEEEEEEENLVLDDADIDDFGEQPTDPTEDDGQNIDGSNSFDEFALGNF